MQIHRSLLPQSLLLTYHLVIDCREDPWTSDLVKHWPTDQRNQSAKPDQRKPFSVNDQSSFRSNANSWVHDWLGWTWTVLVMNHYTLGTACQEKATCSVFPDWNRPDLKSCSVKVLSTCTTDCPRFSTWPMDVLSRVVINRAVCGGRFCTEHKV